MHVDATQEDVSKNWVRKSLTGHIQETDGADEQFLRPGSTRRTVLRPCSR